MEKNRQQLADKLKHEIVHHLKFSLGKRVVEAEPEHFFTALAMAVKDWSNEKMYDTAARHSSKDPKRIYYLSVEYLIGRSLENNLVNLQILDLLDLIKFEDNDIALKDVINYEYDPALGNGGLGRLAACYIDSMATLGMPGYGYGINYQYGLFRQYIENGWQREKADSWMQRSSPWQLERADKAITVRTYGRIEHEDLGDGKTYPKLLDYQNLIGIPSDMPIVGYTGETVNFLRLFTAKSSDDLDINTFNDGGYLKAVEKNILSETITKVLYPSDSSEAGKELRLLQQFFWVSCALNDIMRRFLEDHDDLSLLPQKVAIQLNDTHPALAVAELMRILMDDHNLDFNSAWQITQATIAFTNHTLLPEALEKWSVGLIEKIAPRHMLIIYEINKNLMELVSEKYPGDVGKMQRLSIIEEEPTRKVRMANLSIAGSHKVNGVAEIHSELVKTKLVPDFYELWPEKFTNVTNGVTPRRWLLASNPELSALISANTDKDWPIHLEKLRNLEPLAKDSAFVDKFFKAKKKNKEALAKIIKSKTGVAVDTDSMFDVQVKRIHEYKRQLLFAMYIIHDYLSIIEDGANLANPKTYIMGGKAAPAYYMAKLIIKLVNNIAKVVNNDPRVRGQMRVVFIPDYKVSLAERIFPASDLSEQISTAGFEASGTGNMKFALNGALTIGTLDGANVEIREEVGAENFYLFGLTAEEVLLRHAENSHRPWDYYNNNSDIKRIIDLITSNVLCPDDKGLFTPIYQNIMFSDYYLLLADLEDYIAQHKQAIRDFSDKKLWGEKAILNVARIAKFSSDRSIQDYADNIWDVKPTI